MNTASPAPEPLAGRFARWLDSQDDGVAVAMFRRVFAWIWVSYDAIDLAWGITERSRNWFQHARSPGIVALQVTLVASGVMLALGRRVWGSGMIAAGARAAEAFVFFSLNDFFFVSVVCVLLAHSNGGPFERTRHPRWIRDVLLVQFAWIYVATGVLKLNPDWLDGGSSSSGRSTCGAAPAGSYPGALEKAFLSTAFDARRLCQVGAALEITLGAVLFARRPYWLAAALALAIHGFGALVTNVWFFSASMIAGVLILPPWPGAPGAGKPPPAAGGTGDTPPRRDAPREPREPCMMRPVGVCAVSSVVSWRPLVAGLVSCSKMDVTLDEPKPVPFEIQVNVVSDPGVPLADAQILSGTKVVGTTAAAGITKLRFGGNEGDQVELTIKCPADYESPSKPLSVSLRRFAAGSPPPQFEARCPPALRTLVVGLRA